MADAEPMDTTATEAGATDAAPPAEQAQKTERPAAEPDADEPQIKRQKTEPAAAAADGGEETEPAAAPPADGGEGRNEETARVVAGARFASRTELWERVLETQQRVTGGVAEGHDAFFLFALLSCHPAASEKMAPGARAIGYDTNVEYPDTKSFFVERADGARPRGNLVWCS